MWRFMDDEKTPKPPQKTFRSHPGGLVGTAHVNPKSIARTSAEAMRHSLSGKAPTAEEAEALAEKQRACDILGFQMLIAQELEKIRNDKSWDRIAPKDWMQE